MIGGGGAVFDGGIDMVANGSGVAVVMSGGGARGAFEAGSLSTLLPALAAAGQRPSIFVGTSAGAINAVGFAALSHLSATDAAEAAVELWRNVRSPSVFRRSGRWWRAGRPEEGDWKGHALLDPTPLAETLARVIDWDQLHRNVADGLVSIGVAATASSTHRSTVFVETAPGMKLPSTHDDRSIDYVPATLTPRHVLASAAIPVAFPPVRIEASPTISDWFVDGGLRLNTPLLPALDMGAERVVVLATDPAEPLSGPTPQPPLSAPTLAGGATQVLHAVLVDRMVEDLRTLARKNDRVMRDPTSDLRKIHWLFGGPPAGEQGVLAAIAGDVLRGGCRGQRRRGLLARTARRWVARDPARLELLTHVLFDPDFVEGALRRGQQAALDDLDSSGGLRWRLTADESDGTAGSRGPTGVHPTAPPAQRGAAAGATASLRRTNERA